LVWVLRPDRCGRRDAGRRQLDRTARELQYDSEWIEFGMDRSRRCHELQSLPNGNGDRLCQRSTTGLWVG
jgi:hypothetical protein